MLRTRTDLWRLALFTSLGLCPNACGGRADGDNVGQPDHVTTLRDAGTHEQTTAPTNQAPASPAAPTPSGSTSSAIDGGAAPTFSGVDGGAPACAEVVRYQVYTSLHQCDDGVVHRPTAAHLCQSSLPRPTSDADGAPAFDGEPITAEHECQADADCTDAPHGYCDFPSGSSLPIKQCFYGCVSDSDCATDEACVCGAPVGTCMPATCTEDADCAPGMKCAEWVDPNGVGCPVSRFLSCQTPEDECATDADCDQALFGSFCSAASGTRQCEEIPGLACGRPFLVEGSERRAPLILSDAWSSLLGSTASTAQASEREPKPSVALSEQQRLSLGQRWAAIGQMEHASIAAFARFTLQLLHLGAPASLVEDAQRAMADETRHAQDCFGLASSYLGAAIGPGALSMDRALQETSLEDIVLLTVREGCIGETCAALEAAEAYEETTEPVAKVVLDRIRGDEFRHAELAWRFVSWALTQGAPSADAQIRLRRVVANEFAAAAREAIATRSDTATTVGFNTMPYGIVPEAMLPELRRRALLDIVLPCARGILQSIAPQTAAGESCALSSVAVA